MDESCKLESLFTDMQMLLKGECLCMLGYNHNLKQNVEDILQTVYCRAIEHKDRLLASPNPHGWLILCCRRVCQEYITREARHQRIIGRRVEFEEYMVPASDAIGDWLRYDAAVSLINELQQRLTPREQEIFQAYFIQHRTARQIAEQKGITVNAAKAMIHRIRGKALTIVPVIAIILIRAWITK